MTDSADDREIYRLQSGARVLDHAARPRAAVAEPAEAIRPPIPDGAPVDASALDISGSGAFADFEIVTVTESNTGPFDASSDLVIYDLRPGDYTVRLDNFGSGDIFVPFPDYTVSFPEEADQSDGIQPIAFTDPATGQTATVELAGLTAEQDAAIADLDGLESTFGSGALGEDLIGSGGASGGVPGSGAEGDAVAGNVLVDGAPAETIPESASTLTVAQTGDGALDLSDGATRTFTSGNFETVSIAVQTGVEGTLTLRGEGTDLITAGTDNGLQVSRGGTGALTVANGAEVNTLDLEVAGDGGGEGTVTIRGADSRVVASNDNGLFGGDFSFESGFVRIGEDPESMGTVDIREGGELEVRPGAEQNSDTSGPGISLGEEVGSNGDLIVDGQDSLVDIAQESPLRQFGPFLEVGEGLGQGDVTVRNGATVALTGPNPFIGVSDAQPGGDGAETTTDTAAVETSTVTIESGGELAVTDNGEQGARAAVFVGQRDGADGEVTVTGAGSRIDLDSGNFTQIALGGTPFTQTGGTGRLTVADGGSVDGLTLFTLGAVNGGFGAATLSGDASAVEMAGAFPSGDAAFMQVGRAGTGALTVENGADLTISGGTAQFPGFNVGRNEGASGKLKVRGDGSRIAIDGDNDAAGGGSGFIAVGRAGFGYVTVENGGAIVNDPSGTTFVGREASATGIVSLRDAGSRFDAGEQLLIGADFDFESGEAQPAAGGTGRVRVEKGAALEAGTPDDGGADIVVGAGDTLSVNAGATLRGDVLNEGGTVEIADGATFIGELLETDKEDADTTAPTVGETALELSPAPTAGSTVGTVQLGDDTGVTAATIVSGNPDNDGDGNAAFAVADDGTLTVNDADDLDTADQGSFTLTVEARDAAGNAGTGTVTVELTEGDTVAPTVDEASFGIQESAETGALVGTVQASDDTGVTAFEIADGNPDPDGDGTAAFAIADDGALTVADPDDLQGDGVTLTVEARDDAGNTGSADVTIDVTKVDTSAPTVSDATFSIQAAPDAGAMVGTVSASDDTEVTKLAITDGNADADGDGEPAFALAGDGTLTVNDGDDVVFDGQGGITLTVEARDAAGNAGTGTITVAPASALIDTAGADDQTGTAQADTLTLIADGTDDTFDAQADSVRDTLDLSGLDPARLGETAPTVDLRDGFVETAISGKDTIANFDTVRGSDAGDLLLGRDSSSGVLVGSTTPITPTLAAILDAEQLIDGGGRDTLRLRDGQGIASLVPDDTPESEISAGSTRIVGVNNTGPFDATGEDVTFDIEAGGYSTTIDGFDSGDVLQVFDGVTFNVEFDDDQTDGQQTISLSNSDTGEIATITLTGLSNEQDSNLFQRSSFNNVFGDGTLVEGDAGGAATADLQENGLYVSRANGGVTVDLTAQGTSATVVDGGGLGAQSGDTVRGLDSVEGSPFDDTLTAPGIVVDGKGADEVTFPESGDGRLYLVADGTSETSLQASGGGALNFIAATSAVTLDLSAQGSDETVIAGGGLGSQSGTSIAGFQMVQGSSHADTLLGNGGPNTLDGAAGDDDIDAGAGDDILLASRGSDTLAGGAGADQFDPTDLGGVSDGINRIADFDAGEGDTLSLGKFSNFTTAEDIVVDLQLGETLQDPAAPASNFFGDSDQTPNVVIQDNGTDLTRVFIDGNGDGDYTPTDAATEDSAIELTGTIEATGIDETAIEPL